MAQWVLTRLEEQDYAVPVGDVVEVLRVVALTPLPDSPAWVLGILNLRGRSVPVLDLRRRLGLTPIEVGLDAAIVVVEDSGKTVGLLVDEVAEVVDIDDNSLEPPTGSGQGLKAITHLGSRTILLLDLPHLLDLPGRVTPWT